MGVASRLLQIASASSASSLDTTHHPLPDSDSSSFALAIVLQSVEARVCLCAAGESEKNKLKNLDKVKANQGKIEEALNVINNYKKACKTRGIGYYDAFKLQKEKEDFNANLRRLELAGLFDEILDMLHTHELPDNFESQGEWVNLGTSYRCLVEPLDIANYYRHYKNEDTGPYLINGRPWRYRHAQRWLEHARRMPAGSITDSCFWAKVEELSLDTANGRCFDEMSGRIMELEKELATAIDGGQLDRDVLLEGSTFVRWWKTLPQQHQLGSCIAGLISGEGGSPSSMLY
ncbi:Lipase (class 3) [Asimina triloba]